MSQHITGQHTIQITHLESIDRLNGALCTYGLAAANHIWCIRISSFVNLINELWGFLSADEQERAHRYHREKDKHRFIVSRALLRILLARYLGQDALRIILEVGKNQKPRVKGNNAVRYNVSHSGDLVLIAFSNAEVGIDIEQQDTHLHYHDIMQMCYNKSEIEAVERSAISIEKFYRLWTRKEAFLKATGKGIDDDLKQIPSLDGTYTIPADLAMIYNDLFVKSFDVEAGYVGSLASSSLTNIFWDMPVHIDDFL